MDQPSMPNFLQQGTQLNGVSESFDLVDARTPLISRLKANALRATGFKP